MKKERITSNAIYLKEKKIFNDGSKERCVPEQQTNNKHKKNRRHTNLYIYVSYHQREIKNKTINCDSML